MTDKSYRLRYLLFYDKLEQKVTYFAEKLENPHMANYLINVAKQAILERLGVA